MSNNNIENNNPLLKTSSECYNAPEFNVIELDHYLPAFKKAIELAKGEILEIVDCSQTPTFENTILALENSGELLSNISTIFFNLNNCNTSDKMQQLAIEVMPLITDHSNDISLNEVLFNRVREVYENRVVLSGEDLRLTEKCYKGICKS
ncbi:MAG: hypothetical protein R3Y04_06410, partial [Rikenellaceae bacterium]